MGILANLAAKGNTKLANSLASKIKADTLTTAQKKAQADEVARQKATQKNISALSSVTPVTSKATTSPTKNLTDSQKIAQGTQKNIDILNGTSTTSPIKQNINSKGQQTSETVNNANQPGGQATSVQPTPPKAPEIKPITTEAPKSEPLPTVTSKQEREVRRSVLDDNKSVFDALNNVETLAAQGKTAQIDLAAKQANDIIALLDTQMAQFNELKANKDLTANEQAALQKDIEAANQEKLLAQNAIDRADTAAKYKDAEAQRVQYNENQKVRLETFAGLRNGFGSSAQVTNLENVMNDGQRALEGIQKEAISYDAKYANEAMNIDKDYNLAIGSINANLNSTLRQNYNDLESAVMAINQSKLTTLQQKDSLILQAQTDYNNKVTENQLRVVDTIKQQNAEVQARISQLKQEQYQEYQIKRNEEWQLTNFNLDKEKFGIQQAQNNYDNQLKLYTAVSNIMAQDASNDLELKKFQENIKQFDKEQERLEKELDINTKQFGEKIALEKYIAETDAANKAKQATLDDYIQKEKLKIDQKNSILDEKQIISSVESELRKKYTEIKDTAGNTIGFYDPVKNDFKTNSQLNKEATVNKDYLFYENAVPIGLTTDDRKSVKEQMYSYYNMGEIDAAKTTLENAYIKSSPNARIPVVANLVTILEQLKKDFKDFYDSGGTTDLFSGSEEKFNEFFGITGDEKLARLATNIKANLGNYTSTLSGAQVSDAERKQYEKVLPSISNTKELNLAKLDGAVSAWNKTIKSDIKNRMPETSYKLIYGDTQLSDGSNVDDLFND